MIPEEIFYTLRNPQVYTGRELNAIRRGFAADKLNVCLVFPDTYEIGMSHHGLKILYHLLGADPQVNPERCFLPEPENIPRFLAQETPLFSLESRTPLSRFDLIGVSLLSELNFSNLPLTLRLAGVPLRAAERGEGDPLVGGGGMALANPEPLRRFLDFVAIGDGELLFPDIAALLLAAKRDGWRRERTLAALDALPGVYVPLLHPLRNAGMFVVPDLAGRSVEKRRLTRWDDPPGAEREIVPIGNVVFGRLDVELARGCPQTCRFCQARAYYAPFRPRSAEERLSFLFRALPATGYEAFSLSSLSSGDYPGMNALLPALSARIPAGVHFSVPSLRPKTLSADLLSTLAEFRRTGITIVPEAGSERLRRVINKDVTDEEILAAVDLARLHGWQKLKLYFMVGLPGETDEDLRAIVDLIARIQARGRTGGRPLQLHASFSAFVPKCHTPFQWAARLPMEEIRRRIDVIRGGLRRSRTLDLDFHLTSKGVIETLLGRGDDRVGDLLEAVAAEGERFTAWDDQLHFDVWDRHIQRLGLGPLLGEIPLEAELPWDFVQLGAKKEHLLAEYRKAQAGEPTLSCRDNDCAACQGCLFPLDRTTLEPPPVELPVTAPAAETPLGRVRIFYEKTGDFRFFSHLTMIQHIERLLRRSGVPFGVSGGFHPRMKLASLPPLPVFAASRAEVVEGFAPLALGGDKLLRRLQAVGEGFPFTRVVACPSSPDLMKDLATVTYEFTPPGPIPPPPDGSLAEGDRATALPQGLSLTFDYRHGGIERFGRLYRLLDPERTQTRHLVRTAITFSSHD